MERLKNIWLDGKFVPWNQATTHILTHGLHYGSSVFEGIRFYKTSNGPKIFRLNEHLKRFFYSARSLGLKIPYTQKTLTAACKKLVTKSGMKDGYLRPLAFYGVKNLSILPIGFPIRVALIPSLWPAKKNVLNICLSPYIRIHPQSTDVHAKIGGHYVNSIVALMDARKRGFDEVIFLDDRGYVAEGAVANVFMIKNGTIYTPKVPSILPGITRDTIIELVRREFKKRVIEKDMRLSELLAADEVFFTGTAYEVTPIARIGTKRFAISSMTKRIRDSYTDVVRGKLARYRSWLV